MIDRRTPRGHRQEAIGQEPEEQVPVAPVLVEHLERKFPISLSPEFARDQAILTLHDQAEQRGRQQVIDYLRTLSNPNA